MRATCSRRRARPFAAAFPSAVLAVDAALHAQHSLLDEPWAGGVAVRVRMGTHTGEAVERGGDYFGSTLNRGNVAISVAAVPFSQVMITARR